MRPIDADELKEIISESPDDIVDITLIFDLIDDQPTVNEWIPCSKKLPENGQYVLVMYRDNREVMKKSMFDNGWVDCDGNWYAAREITAWMPLPEGYKGDE